MSKMKLFGFLALFVAVAMMAMTQAVAADRKTTNAVIGAGIGAAAGAVITQGGTVGTLGGAAAGGLLGYVLTDEPRKERSRAHGPSRHPHHVDRHRKRGHAHYAPSRQQWKHPVRGDSRHHHGHRSRHHAHR